MYFYHSDDIWERFPTLRALTLVLRGVINANKATADVSKTLTEVGQMLQAKPESELAPIQAWRHAYARMGLKPTQYRCAAEALLRRFRKDGELPRLHPLVDVLNAESMLASTPIAAFDAAQVAQGITVQPALGNEIYTTFQGEIEHPEKDEIVFVDAAGSAHSRRWVHRQGAVSAVRDSSNIVLIVAEALHETAEADLEVLHARLLARAGALGIRVSESLMVKPQARRLEFRLEDSV